MPNDFLVKRAEAIEKARALKSEHEAKGTMSDDIRSQIQKHMDEAKAATADARQEQEMQAEEKAIADIRSTPAAGTKVIKPENNLILPGDGRHARAWDNDNYRRAHAEYLRTGEMPRSEEYRAMIADISAVGGFTLAPSPMVATFLKNVDDQTKVRGLATVIPMPRAVELRVPELGDDASDPEWTTEVGTATEGADMTFTGRTLKPHPMTKLQKLSRTLIDGSALDIEAFVLGRLARKFAVAEENAFVSGNGVNKPLGMFTASDNGIPTSRDKSTGNTATAITFDGLIKAKYSLKDAYRALAQWMFHTDALEQLSLIQDLEDRYVWQPSVLDGQPDRLLSRPIVESRFCPNTFTASQYVGLLGDFSYYWIAESLAINLQVLIELYALSNQSGYVLRQEVDGQPVLAEAFTRIQLAAS